ncbi:hypothetical protein AAMO2058_001203900 [Amorphochlora amoebiformis]
MDVQTETSAHTLGLASFFLGVAYAGISIWSFGKLRKISEFVHGWSTQRCFYVFLVIHLVVRMITWASICWTYFTGKTAWYPYMVVLQSFPETLFLSAYLLLIMHWIEIYIFTHDQFIFPSRTFFHRRWRTIYLVLIASIFVILAVFYLLLATNQIGNPGDDIHKIYVGQAVGNFALPGFFIVTWAYFSFGFSGFGYSSSVEYRKLVKLNYLMSLWAFGRLVRGFGFLWSEEEQSLDPTFQAMILVTTMVLTELIQFLFTMDWEIVSLLLLAEEGPGLRLSRQSSDYKLLRDGKGEDMQAESKFFLDPQEIHFLTKRDMTASGAFCVVQKAKYQDQTVFVKTFRFAGLSSAMIQNLAEDLIRQSSISHEKLVDFHGVFLTRGSISRVTSYCECGSLRDVLRECTRPLLRRTLLRIAFEVSSGIRFLHNMDIPRIHGNLKTTNVLIGRDMEVKISDIGLRRIKSCLELTSLQRSFTAFTSPEVFIGHPPTRKADVYAFSYICWELLSRIPPFENRSLAYIRDFIVAKRKHLPLDESTDVPGGFYDLVEKMRSYLPDNRPSLDDIYTDLQSLLRAEEPAADHADEEGEDTKDPEASRVARVFERKNTMVGAAVDAVRNILGGTRARV